MSALLLTGGAITAPADLPGHHATELPRDERPSQDAARVNPEAEVAYNLAVKHRRAGHGTDATSWFRKAAELGHGVAQDVLGAAYEAGAGVKKNNKEALYWYARAAAQDVPEGQYHLGSMYAKGRGVKRNDALAAKWYKLAADRDVGAAQYELGLLYLTGRGVQRDDVEAYFWLTLAARKIDAAMEKRDAAEKRLTPEKLTAARFLVKTWQPVK